MIKAKKLDNEEILERMRDACHLPTDAELAKYLETTPSAVSSWKRIKSPPYHGCFRVSLKTGISMEWLLTGAGNRADNSNREDRVFNDHSISREEFVSEFMTIIDIGTLIGFLSKEDGVTISDIERLGNALFDKTAIKR